MGQRTQYYKGSTFYGDWTLEEMQHAIKIDGEMWASMNDPANFMTVEEHLALLADEDDMQFQKMMEDQFKPDEFLEGAEIKKLSLKEQK